MKRLDHTLIVLCVVAYLSGAAVIALATYGQIAAFDEPDGDAPLLVPVIIGFGLMMAGVVLQRSRQDLAEARAEDGTEPPEPRPSLRQILRALAVFLAPIAIAWLQFELYFEAVWMFPIVTVAIGCWVGSLVGRRLLPTALSRTGSMLGVLLLGLPGGVLGVWLPAQHFTAHLSPVHTVSLDDGIGNPPGEPTQPYYRWFSPNPTPPPDARHRGRIFSGP